jgi:4'-phosphopantetheinyl transferase
MQGVDIWQLPDRSFSLPRQEVHVWRVSLDQDPNRLTAWFRLLSPDEQERADRFHFESDRARFIVGRGRLREILGEYLQEAPEQLQFCYGDRGKPALANPTNSPVRFNLAHSQGMALCAVTCDLEVGVDLEQIRPMPKAEKLAMRYFSASEVAALQTLSPDERLLAFFQCWTCKEAYVKAIGTGLAHSLQQIEICWSEGIVKLVSNPNNWTLHCFTPASDFVAALVVAGDGLVLRYFAEAVEGQTDDSL